MNRSWKVSEASSTGAAVDVGAIDIQVDLSDLDPLTIVDVSLLVDSNNDGSFGDEAPIKGATDLGGGLYAFTGISALADNATFTIGINLPRTEPLPAMPLWGTALFILLMLSTVILLAARLKVKIY